LYNEVARNRAVDAIIISNRRLYGPGGADLPSVRVPELPPAATQNLLRLIGRDRGLSFDVAQLETLAIYSRGYPPAVQFAVDEARTYGVAHVMANQAALVNFSAEIFLKQLRSDNRISMNMSDAMKLLSSYSPLPLSVIGNYCGIAQQEFVHDMEYLIDSVFVLPEGANYRISEPVRDAAYRAFGGMMVDHGRVLELLEEYIDHEPDDDARLSLSQCIFRASLLAGSGSKPRFAVGLASDFIQVATQSYHDQDYDLAIKYGMAAIDLRPQSVDLRRYVAQALIRKEHDEEAETHITALIDAGQLKEAYYVRGFAARRKREYTEAIAYYEKSLAHGRRGVAVHREFAICYFEDGNIRKAEVHIREAERQSPHNKYIIDLRCVIAIRLGDLTSAERTLDILDRVETGGFAEHRRSTFEQARGDHQRALEYALTAMTKMPNPPFEVVANLANCQIEAGRPEDAIETLTLMAKRFRGTHHDAQVGLRCKYEIRFGEISNAGGLWRTLREKRTPVHSGLRLAMLGRNPIRSGEQSRNRRISGLVRAQESIRVRADDTDARFIVIFIRVDGGGPKRQ
jgi:tetratricopeptide (TPR) repeat protein